jgi:hypothetical protein
MSLIPLTRAPAVRSLSSTHLCPIESQVPLKIRMHRRDTAARVQALWRGYKVRKGLQTKNQQEVALWEPYWHLLDERYRLCVFCQTMEAALHTDDPSWDAEGTPYYRMMMEEGPTLDELERFLFKRGWVRPPPKPLCRETAMLWMSIPQR